MKKVIIAALALTGFSVASFAQAVPAVKKSKPSKMLVVKKQTDVKAPSKVVALNKVKAPVATPVATKVAAKQEVKTVAVAKVTPVKQEVKTVAVNKPAAITKVAGTAPLKKVGTPDKRFKTNTDVAKGPLKKDGTPDMRYKANKKQ